MPVNINPIPPTCSRSQTRRFAPKPVVRRSAPGSRNPMIPCPTIESGGRIRISESELVERFPGPWRDRPAA